MSRASRSSSANGRPSALPTSRIAPAGAVGREARDERRVLAAVALADADDQLLPDVARKVEVDVRNRDELAVEEAPERKAGVHRVDVREPGQVADDRADRAPAAAARREHVARHRLAAHLPRALPRQLQHLPVEEEEPREPELLDQLQLLLEPAARLALVAVRSFVAPGERAVADAPELRDRRLARVREVRIAVAEVLGQVELQPLGQLAGSLDGVAVERELCLPARPAGAGRSRGSRAAPPRSLRARCGGGSRRGRPGATCGADGASGRPRSRPCARPAPRRGRAARRAGSRRLARTAVAARRRSAPARTRAPGLSAPFGLRTARPCRAHPERQTSPSFSSASSAGVERRRQRLRAFLRPRSRVRRGQQAAEVRVALRRLDEQRHVRAVRERHLGAGDRAHAERPRRVRELERAVHPVVVGQRERLVAQLGRAGCELLRQRGAVEERIG